MQNQANHKDDQEDEKNHARDPGRRGGEIGLGIGASTIDEDCTIREYVTLMYNMCAAGNQTWCQVADRMLLNEVDMITTAWNDVHSPPPATAPSDSGELTRLYRAGCRWN